MRSVICIVLLQLLLLVSTTPSIAETWVVPFQAPTIQAGIDSAVAGDTVLVMCNTYYEHGIEMKSGVCLRSLTGIASCVTIDGETTSRVFFCDGVDNTARIEGFTITGG